MKLTLCNHSGNNWSLRMYLVLIIYSLNGKGEKDLAQNTVIQKKIQCIMRERGKQNDKQCLTATV